MTDRGSELFASSSFCGFEDPERQGWRCVMAPGKSHEGRKHVYGRDLNLGTVPRDNGTDSGSNDPVEASDRA